MSGEIDYFELKYRLKKGNLILIDIRDESEIEAQGKIPNSINIPFKVLKKNLEDVGGVITAGNIKISPPQTLVFSGLNSRNTKTAYDLAVKAGFLASRLYPGGLNDWARNGGKVEIIKKKK